MSDSNVEPIAVTEQKAKDLAISAMAVSIALFLMSCGVFSFVGALMGQRALQRLTAAGVQSHRGFATAAVVIGWLGTALSLLVLMIGVAVLVGYSLSS